MLAKLSETQLKVLDIADYLEKNGWCQGELYCGDAACLYGASIRVGSFEALRLIEKTVGMALIHWNDELGRTKEEVISTLRNIALKG